MSLWKEPKPDNGHLGEPMERLMFDFLVRSFGSDKVVLQPGRYPSNIGNTYPDVMVKDSNCRLFADVTVSPLDTGSWLMREDPKKSQRHIFENPSEIGVAGIAIYQQVIMLPEGYQLVAEIALDVLLNGLSSRVAQSRIDKFCSNYSWSVLSAMDNDWEQTAVNLRGAMSL